MHHRAPARRCGVKQESVIHNASGMHDTAQSRKLSRDLVQQCTHRCIVSRVDGAHMYRGAHHTARFDHRL